MKSFNKVWLLLGLAITFLQFNCSDEALSPNANSGVIKLSIKTVHVQPQLNSKSLGRKVAGAVTITSARVVIKEIEFESIQDDTLDFEFERPFVKDLLVGSNLHEIESILVPFGSYKESEIEIDDLKAEDGEVYNQNPDLQDRSVLVQGYLNDDPNDIFTFASDLDKEQEKEFNPPLTLDENSPTTNIVLTLDMSTWFMDENGNPLDPRLESNRSKIENNIKNSIDVFEDEDDDGEIDDDD